jgi:hypothetical protein
MTKATNDLVLTQTGFLFGNYCKLIGIIVVLKYVQIVSPGILLSGFLIVHRKIDGIFYEQIIY